MEREAFSYTLSNIERVRGSRNGGDDLEGSDGDDRLDGYGGDDILEGRGGDDELYGGDGEDWLIGAEGDDRLSGGDGDDAFVFEGAHGHDRIDDFEDGNDLIVLFGLSTLSKQDVLDHASAGDDGTGVHIDLTGFGGGTIDLHGLHRDDFDASDFLL